MPKWEYKVKVMVRGDIIKSMLDVLGEKGWELISCEGEMQANYYQLIFKRPIEEPTKIDIGPGQTIYYLPHKE